MELKTRVAWLEDAIITISGPALAISGIIAGVDLVTGGNILKSIWWLSLVWAITLLLTLDFQVLALGVRAHRVYVSKKDGWQKFGEIVLAIFIAAAISAVSIQMQSIIARVNAEGVSIDTAAVQLGINTIWLIWERSTLVLVLIFMSGWLREQDSKDEKPVQAVPSIDELMKHPRFEALIEQTVRITVAQTTNPNMLAIPPANRKQIDEAENNDQPIFPSRFASKEDDVARVLQDNPQATIEEVARLADCSPRTAERWIQKLQENAS